MRKMTKLRQKLQIRHSDIICALRCCEPYIAQSKTTIKRWGRRACFRPVCLLFWVFFPSCEQNSRNLNNHQFIIWQKIWMLLKPKTCFFVWANAFSKMERNGQLWHYLILRCGSSCRVLCYLYLEIYNFYYPNFFLFKIYFVCGCNE